MENYIGVFFAIVVILFFLIVVSASRRNKKSKSECQDCCKNDEIHDDTIYEKCDENDSVCQESFEEEPVVKFYYPKSISKPFKKIPTDAGWDLTTPEEFTLAPKETLLIDTNVITDIPEGYVGILKSRSGLACKMHIDTANAGVIDSSYRGNIKVLLENKGDIEYIANAGDRICQILILKCLLNAEFIEGTPKETTERGTNGFGSSGR